MNKILLIGRLTKDVELRYGGQNNTAIGSFTLVTDRKFKTKDASADFFNCVCLGKMAENLEKWCKRGQELR